MIFLMEIWIHLNCMLIGFIEDKIDQCKKKESLFFVNIKFFFLFLLMVQYYFLKLRFFIHFL